MSCIEEDIAEEYQQIKRLEKDRLELVYREFGPEQYWEELHYIMNQVLRNYNYMEVKYGP